MTEKTKYATGSALRAALEVRLKEIAQAEGVELQRLRRQVVGAHLRRSGGGQEEPVPDD